MQTIVIGGGVMGCATAYHLAKDGQRVTLLEQYAIGHRNGSSHGPSRIIRLAYDGADYVELAQTSFALWRQLEADTGQQLLLRVGGIDFGVPEAEGMAGIRATYEDVGVPFEELDRAGIMRKYPQFNLPEGTIGFFQPDYSILAADRCVASMAEQARRFGAQIHEYEPALAIDITGSGVTVRTAQATYHADRLVLAAGSWVAPLAQQLDLALPVTVKKEQLAFFQPRDPALYQPGPFPLFIHRFVGTTVLGSGFPIFDHSGVKLMLDRIGPDVTPDDPDRSIDAANLERLLQYANQLLPHLDGELIETVSCRYTMTTDEDFVIGPHPKYPQVIIGSPCSGHGFKFGIVIGRILADLAIHGETAHPIERFRLDRPGL